MVTEKIAEMMILYHAIERISPKGPGHKYIGRCWQCGKTNLTLDDAREPCENTANFTEEESILRAITGTEDDLDGNR